MFFRRKSGEEGQRASTNARAETAEPGDSATTNSRPVKQVSTADTAHLVGPGCVRLEGRLPLWQSTAGARLQLHPKYLRRLLCYGNVDITTAALRLFWRRGIQVVFLSPSGERLLGKLQPAGNAPHLPRLQHLAAEQPAVRLALATELVEVKLESTLEAIRYFQRQGRGAQPGKAISAIRRFQEQVESADSVAKLRGLEGASAARWFSFLATVLPEPWEFQKRVSRPPTDPVNALLSLGYSLAHHRCETLLAAADLDPRVGFLHDLRSGRSSLACDLVEPLRVPLVDRMVVQLLARRTIKHEDFATSGTAFRLGNDAFKRYLAAFEQAFDDPQAACSLRQATMDRINAWTQRFRQLDTPAAETM